MYQGFYNLASGMLTQNRNLNVIGNNMVNVQTPGYKNDTMVASTFSEELLYRTGRHYKENAAPLAPKSVRRPGPMWITAREALSRRTGFMILLWTTKDFSVSRPRTANVIQETVHLPWMTRAILYFLV